MRVPASGDVCRRHGRHSHTSRVEWSPADFPEHVGHTKPSGHRRWARYSRQVCGVEQRWRHSRLSFGNSGRPRPAESQQAQRASPVEAGLGSPLSSPAVAEEARGEEDQGGGFWNCNRKVGSQNGILSEGAKNPLIRVIQTRADGKCPLCPCETGDSHDSESVEREGTAEGLTTDCVCAGNQSKCGDRMVLEMTLYRIGIEDGRRHKKT